MKRSTRVLAMMLAIVFAVYGYPMVPTSAEEDTGGVITETAPGEENTTPEETVSDDGSSAVQPSADTLAEEEPAVDEDTEDLMDTSNMKFVQTGFDPDTGMLTMTLRVKPTTLSYDGSGNYTGTHISEGFFSFSVDPDSVVPYTVKTENGKLVPDQDLLATNGTAVLVGGGVGLSEENKAAMFQSFITDTENSRARIVTGDFNAAMPQSVSGGLKYSNAYSALVTSSARISETGLMDCYLHFRVDSYTPTIPVNGYVDVANVYFLCYSSENNGMNPVVAKSDNELFCNSIQIPDDAAEAEAITNSFYTMKNDTTSPTLSFGAAGYVEKTMEYNSGSYSVIGYASDYYYYHENSRIAAIAATESSSVGNTFWQAKAPWNGTRNPSIVSGKPYLYFRNVNKTYLLENFSAVNRNIFDTEPVLEAGVTPDFYRPSDEAYYYPRYTVPTREEDAENDVLTDWRPMSYVPPNAPEGTAAAKVPLKYDIRTTVSDNSITNPETEDRELFFNSIAWEFALQDGTPLSSCTTTNIAGSGKEVQYRDKEGLLTTVYAVEAYLNGGSYILWNVYESESAFNSGAEPIMTTPVGVLMELADSSITIVSMDENEAPPASDEGSSEDEGADEGDRGTVIEVTAKAPQLHVTNLAADVRSYLWNNDTEVYNGQIVIKATYTSKIEETYSVNATTVKLYKEEAKPDYTTLNVEEVGTVNDGTSNVTGFEVGLNDRVTAGIPVYSYVYDQYDTLMNSSFSELSFDTEEIIPAGKANAFTVTQDSTNKHKYYITYGKDENGRAYNVNETVGGLYKLTASCEEAEADVKDVFVKREDDKLTYLELAASTGTPADLGGKDVVYVNVPALDSNGNTKTETMNINITVLANQWYLSSNSQEASRYDIAQNIRNASGFIDLTAAREHVEITYDAEYAANTDPSLQKGVVASELSSGTLYYDTTVANNIEYIITVTAKYGDETITKQLSIIFQHAAQSLNKIEVSGAESIVVDPVRNKEASLGAQVRDQYGQVWSWNAVYSAYAPGGRLNAAGTESSTPWTIELAEGSTLPADGSIRFSGDHKEKITVTSAAESRTLKVQAVYVVPNHNNTGSDLTFRSPVYTIEVRREASKPTGVSVNYQGLTEFVPGQKSASGSANDQKFTPTVTVTDQYGATMDPNDYELTFSLRAVGSTDGKVYLDRVLTGTDPETGENTYNEVGQSTGVIVVEECAMNCTAEIGIMAVGSAGSAQTKISIGVKRNLALVSTVNVSNESVNYPKTSEPASYKETLVAVGETQYGDGQAIDGTSFTWELVSVTVGSNTYTGSAAAGKGINLSRTTGDVTFGRTLTSRSDVPTSFKVKVTYNSDATVQTEKEVKVNLEAPKASTITIYESSYNKGIEVPSAAVGTVTNPLGGEVRDQYNLRIDGAALDWSITYYDPEDNKEHVSIDASTGVITVGYKAVGGFVGVRCSYTSGGTTISNDVEVGITAGSADPKYVNFYQVRNSAGETFELEETRDPGNSEIITATATTIPLPSALEKSATYDLFGRVRDQSLNTLAGVAITWSIDSSSPNLTNATINASNGKLTVNYTADARDAANGESVIVVKASAGGGAAVGTLTITVKKEEDKPTYAIPSYEIQSDRIDGASAVVPKRGESSTEITYTAKVFSQYEQEMPGEEFTLELLTVVPTALTFTTTATGATLGINAMMTGSFVEVAAYAADNTEDPDFTVSGSTVRVTLAKGPSYPYALMLGSSAAIDDNVKTVNITPWQTTGVENVSSPVSYMEVSFDALVVDQSDAPFPASYPVWEIATEKDADGNDVLPEGVRFASTGNTFKENTNNTQVRGNTVVLEIASTAVTPEELSKEIKLNVWTEDSTSGNIPYSDPIFKKTLTFTLNRSASEARYLYFSSTDSRNAVTTPDVDENGDAEFDFPRPTTAEISKLYSLSPKVFDQYGFHITEEFVQMDLDYSESSPLATGYQLVVTYASGESEEDGHVPETYAVWKLPVTDETAAPTPTTAGTDTKVPTGSVLMAEFNTKTGELVLYSTCTIAEFGFSAASETLGISKNITVAMSEAERTAMSVEIVRGHSGTYTINKSSDENLTEDVSAVIYDQYGERYAKTDIVVDWKLLLPDGDDEDTDPDAYIEYQEEDDTLQKDPKDYLVLLSNPNTAETSKQITIQQQQFGSINDVLLTAELRRRNTTSQLGIGAVSTISMRTQSSGSSYYVSLYFDAGGEYGKLVGPAMVSVRMGEYPAEIPGVKTIEGYGFFGWTSDGFTLVDPLKMPATTDMVYYAVYRDITDTQFIDGYKDKTFKPNEYITRAEYVKMVVEATCPDFDLEGVYDVPFEDVDKEMWYAKYIGYAYDKGLVDGYGNNDFKPENLITRAEAVKILSDAAAMSDMEDPALSEFSDVDRSRWYTIYIDILYSLGVIDGYPDGTFRPNDNVTRAEAAKLVVSVTENALSDLAKRNIIENAYCPFTDIRRSHWAYAYILRSAGIA